MKLVLFQDGEAGDLMGSDGTDHSVFKLRVVGILDAEK